jgi:hypothetical protein
MEKIHINYNDVVSFKDEVNNRLDDFGLEDEAIDFTMASKYVVQGYLIDEAVDDICNTLELMME